MVTFAKHTGFFSQRLNIYRRMSTVRLVFIAVIKIKALCNALVLNPDMTPPPPHQKIILSLFYTTFPLQSPVHNSSNSSSCLSSTKPAVAGHIFNLILCEPLNIL
jgi:hypothetical protein